MGEKGEISHDWSNWKTKNNKKKKWHSLEGQFTQLGV
jgi:hypothetical protein